MNDREPNEESTLRCDLCGEVSPRNEYSIKKKTTKRVIISKYTCPKCQKVCKEERQDLTLIDKIEKVEELDVPKLSFKERKEIVSGLVEEMTNAKPSWSHFICQVINTTGRGNLLDQAIAKGTTDKTLWKKVMKLYEASRNEEA